MGRVVVAVGALLLLAAPAQGAADGDSLGLAVTVGYDGADARTAWQPVQVHVEPSRPVAGNLQVTSRTEVGAVVARVPIEVAASSREVHRVLVPRGRVTVEVVEDDGTLTRGPRPSAGGSGDYLVGVLGLLPSSLPPLRSPTVGQSGRWVAVDPAWAEGWSASLDPLGTLVADVAALTDLSDQGQANIAAAVTAGTDLVVVADGGQDLSGLGLPGLDGVGVTDDGTVTAPADRWVLTGAEVSGGTGDTPLAMAAPAGLGRVVVTSVSPGSPGPLGRSGSLWSALAQPSGRQDRPGSEFEVTRTPYQFPRLLSDQTGEAPTLPWLGLFFLLYVVVVGPLNGFLLSRMGRRELAWATIPLVTAIFSVGAYLGATTGRPPTGAVATLTTWSQGSATRFVAAGVRAATPGRHTVVLPGQGWAVRPLLDGEQPAIVDAGADTTVVMEVTALQLGGVAAWRPVSEPPPMEVTARPGPDGLAVTVRNTGTGPIGAVAVRAAGASVRIGDLAAGGEETVDIGGSELPQRPAYQDTFGEVSGGAGASPPRTLEAVFREMTLDQPGSVWAIGVAEAAGPSGVRSDSGEIEDKGALVAVGATVPHVAGQPLSGFAVDRDLVMGQGGEHYRPGPTAVEGPSEAFLRFRLPPGAQGVALAGTLERGEQQGGSADIEVWDPGRSEWVASEEALPARGADAERFVGPLGEVWVRASGELFPFEFSARSVGGGS